MRPLDENQSTPMRPNLMSPRRTSGEDSILAMLERDTVRKRGAAPVNGRLVGYSVGALMAVALTGALVWLAAGNEGLQPEVQRTALAETARSPQPQLYSALQAPTGGATVRQLALATTAPPEPRQGNAALIVDQRPTNDGVPPLRLLKPTPAKAAPPVRVPVPAPHKAAPARPVAKSTPPPRPATTSRLELKQAAPPAGPSARAVAPVARTKPLVAAKSPARPAPSKAQRGAAPARTPDAPADSDVALISAVITHANGHAPEGSQMTELLCPNNTCQSKPARQ